VRFEYEGVSRLSTWSAPAARTATPPKNLNFCYVQKPKTDLSLFYSVNPQQLPKELDGVEWPLNA
jgi:hypothetical protein